MTIARRTFLVAAGSAALLAAAPAQAAKLSLADVSAYLNSVITAKARFTQINDDGTRSAGTFLMRRPGRMRFEYDPPEESLVISGQGELVIFDAHSNEAPQKFQLESTPLKLILGPNIDLTQQRMVVAHEYDGKETIVTAQDPKHPEYGALQVYFGDGPVLTRWVVIDGSGARTSVFLDGFQTGMRLDTRLFNVDSIMAERGLD